MLTRTSPKRVMQFAILAVMLAAFIFSAQPNRKTESPPQPTRSILTLPEFTRVEAPAEQITVVRDSETEKEVPADATSYSNYVFREFDTWLAKYLAAENDAARTALEAEGHLVAVMRRQVLATLIETQPDAALQKALPIATRKKLPASVAAHLEERISAEGIVGMVISTPLNAGDPPHSQRMAEIGRKTYRAFTNSARFNPSTYNKKTSLHGIAIDDAVALSGEAARIAEPGEFDEKTMNDAKQMNCPVSGKPIAKALNPVLLNVSGRAIYICCGGHISEADAQAIAAAGGDPTSASEPAIAQSAWTTGVKRVLYIIVRYSDQAAEPQSFTDATNMMNTVSAFLSENSYGLTSFNTTVTPCFVLPQNTAYYVTNGDTLLMSDARAVAKANGFDYATYDLDAIRFAGGPGGYAGQAYVGWRGVWLKSSSPGVAAHEFGHNYGLMHANYWNTTDGTTIGTGSNQEYGDPFDTMGSAGAGAQHYNAYEKNKLEWIPATNITTITTSGQYRVYAFDSTAPAAGTAYGLKIAKDTDRDYWIDLRQKFTSNAWLMNGIELHWDAWASSNGGSQLLDTTPGSSDGKNDSAIVIGRTFSDSQTGIHITPVGKGNTTPQSIDVVVNIGTFPTDNAPVIASLTCNPLSPVVNSAATLNCSASDPDGDTLAFFWEFGDGTFSTNNQATQSKTWSSANSYTVKCTVSDRKGKTAVATLNVGVVVSGTFAVSGNITSGGSPLAGVVVSDGSRSSTTDSAGNYSITNVPNGTYTLTPSRLNYVFSPTSQSVSVSNANVGGKNFVATLVAPPPNGPGTGITREWWLGIAGTAVGDMTSNANYPNSPSGIERLTSLFEGPTNWADNYGERIRGYFIAPVSGSYTFFIASDDNGELWLSTDSNPANKQKIASVPSWTNSREWSRFPEQKSTARTLTAGQRYYIEALMKEGGGGDNLAVGVQYSNGSLEQPIPYHRLDPWVNAPVATKLAFVTQPSNASAGAVISPAVQVAVQDASGTTVPGAINSVTLAIGTNPGSGTLSGTLQVAAVNGVATFTNLSINNAGAGYTLNASSGNLTGATSSPFTIGAPPGNGQGLTGAYFDNADFTNLKLVRTDATVNFDWGGGSPDASIGADTFSVRWTGKVQPLYTETYTFYTTSDDGVRLWVNGQQIINNWTDHAPTENSGTIALSAGQQYDIRMDMFENGGGATAKLSWSSATETKKIIPQSQLFPAPFVGTGTGLAAQYFDNMDFTSQKIVRTDPVVNFDWSTGSPDPTVGADTFSVRWSGQVQAQWNGNYIFYTTSDDGVRLWVNGVLAINNWTDHAATENSAVVALSAGQKVDLKMEVYENGGYATASLMWSHANTPKQIIPQSQLYPAALSPEELAIDTTLTVDWQIVVPNNDRDGDGLENDFELAIGTNPDAADSDGNGIPDAQETISGGSMTYADAQAIWKAGGSIPTATPPGALTITHLSGGVRFDAPKRDSLAISGTIPKLPDGFNLTGCAVGLDVSGAKAVFTLDAKGRGKSAAGAFAIKLAKSHKSASFALKLKGGTWSGLWSEAGIDRGRNEGNAQFAVLLSLGANNFASDVSVPYTSVAGKSGKFKK
jgi:hypothetical protein